MIRQHCAAKLGAVHARLKQLADKASLLDDYAELSLDALLANTSPHPRLQNLLKKHRVLLPPLLQCFLNR